MEFDDLDDSRMEAEDMDEPFRGLEADSESGTGAYGARRYM